jgi:aspartyl protease family protein
MFPVILFVILTLAASSSHAGGPVEYMVFDGGQYRGQDLERASMLPAIKAPPTVQGKQMTLQVAPDGHFYVAGHINGHPVTFLIDTGATYTAVPVEMARNMGVRTARKGVTQTAAGPSATYLTRGNVVHVGPFYADNATVTFGERLQTPLLGQDVLNRFRITHERGVMILSTP